MNPTEGPHTKAYVHQVVDSGYVIPELIVKIHDAIASAYTIHRDDHPGGIEVGLYIRPRGRPEPADSRGGVW